jgi:hypothetical protein
VDDSMVKPGARAVQPIPLTKRKYLANFLGRAQGKVGRLKLVELAKQYPDKVCLPFVIQIQFNMVLNCMPVLNQNLLW